MNGRQILVVDDEPKMRRVLEIMLQKMGHRVLGAGNGVVQAQHGRRLGVRLHVAAQGVVADTGHEQAVGLEGVELVLKHRLLRIAVGAAPIGLMAEQHGEIPVGA